MNDLKSLRNKRVLVTGGAGFIGSSICEELLNLGVYVTCLDNLSTGKLTNIKSILDHQFFKFILADICDRDVCNNACKNQDYIIHHAALASVPLSIENPSLTTKVNILGTVNILNAAVGNHVKKFIFASSSSVYGDNNKKNIESEIGNLLNPYSISKLCNEYHAINFSKIYDLKVIGFRYFNVYGPRQSQDGPYAAVIPNFINALINQKSHPIIYGSGKQTRDFIYIEDVVRANILALLIDNTGSINQIYNIASSIGTNIIDLLKTIEGIIYSSEIVGVKGSNYLPERLGEIQYSVGNIDKAQNNLGFNVRYTLESGLRKTLSDFKLPLRSMSLIYTKEF